MPSDASPYVAEYHPSPNKQKARAQGPPLRQQQWRNWTYNVLPKLVPVFLRLWHETESLRTTNELALPPTRPCACKTRTLDIAVVRMSAIEHIRIRICHCQTAGEQLLTAGLFPCSPHRPSLAVDIGVLEFVRRLFVNLPPNNTAFCNTLEGFLASRGYKLTTKDTLRVRFANALEWYTTLRTVVGNEIDKLLNATRQILRGDEISDPPATPAQSSAVPSAPAAPLAGAPFPPSSPTASVPPPPSGQAGPGKRHRAHVSEETDSEDEGAGDAPNPFPDPPPRTRPSDYLISRCPACFGGLEHDASQQVDIEVCLDGCYTQKRKHTKTGRDPPRMHPQTRFVSEATAQKMDEHVETVRPPKPAKAKQPRGEEEADGPPTKSADEKRKAASTQFFDDTGLMAILCRHDRVLWLVNMRTPGEKQYYALALLEMLFQHLPLNIRVGVLYDIACQLHCSCAKFGFLGRYLHCILFAVSVFHAFAHRWACQLIYHPLKCRGFGFTNGEGCERFWHSISKLIPYLRVAGYHNRLHTIDSQIEHADKASLGRLGSWLVRRTVHCEGKRREAERDLTECGIEEDVLREEWKKQVAAQTKPAQRRSKTRGSAAVEEVILARKRVNALFQSMTVLRDALGDLDSTAHVLLYAESRVENAEAAWRREQQKLKRLEQQLGVTDATLIEKLRHSDYYAARMNAKVMKDRLCQRLRERKFELDLIERSFRRSRSENQKNDHAGAAIKRREPTISNTVKEYNKLCADIASLIRSKKAPAGAVALSPIPAKDIFQLYVDDAIWQDMGLDEDTAPAAWLVDDKVRAGIRAMLQKDRCNEEAPRLKRERRHLQIWFATEWEAVSETMKIAQGAGAVQYQLQLRREELLELCVLWKKSLDSLTYDGDLPPWGLTQEEILDCQISGVTASYGNGQDSDEEGNSDDDERAGSDDEEDEGGDELLYVLEAVEHADNHRQGGDVEEAQWASDDDEVFT
ncbi:hypothetical protein DFH08DRAFT_971233 [Mycena albidolilacea]|uniref:CxC2-like cysteine cluster KDZ transposase-associated domain-containing protein n=1 Tax=Mycena albidolilacea TaxID=1033008 RepID=A0AAD7EG52_9AGAR|nr:hypothetical protein DFH08DRAFT_971233 [Mycena albidolilacea]